MTQPKITKVPVVVSPSNQAGWWTPFFIDNAGYKFFACCVPAITGRTGWNNIAVIRMDGSDGFVTGWIRNKNGNRAEFINDSGHNQPSIAVDIDGFIHVFTSMHTNYWNYYRSLEPGDVNSIVNSFDEMPDTIWQYTYPVVSCSSSGDVFVMLRGGATANEFDRAGIIYKRNRLTATWERNIILANESNRSFYPDDLQIGPDGTAHILWEWGPYGAGVLRHLPSYVTFSSQRAMADVSGQSMKTPISVSQSGNHIYQPMVEGESFVSNDAADILTVPGVQSAKMVYDNGQFFGVVYRYRPNRNGQPSTIGGFNIKLARFDGSNWTYETVFNVNSDSIMTSATVAATVISGAERLYFSIEKTDQANTKAVLVMAVRNGSSWRFYKISGSYNPPLRVSAKRMNQSDYLYLTAPTEGGLYLYEVPPDMTGTEYYDNQEDLISSI